MPTLKLSEVDRRLTQSIKLISVFQVFIYLGLYLHHHYWTPHSKAPTLNIPFQFISPLLSFAQTRFWTVIIFGLATIAALSWNNFTRASIFCYWVGFDNVCYATEIRFRLAQAYGVAVFALLATRMVENIKKRGEKPDGKKKEE